MNDFLPSITASINNSIASLSFFLPELALIVAFLLAIITDLFFSKKQTQLNFIVNLLSLVVITYLTTRQLYLLPFPLFGGLLILDNLSVYFKLLFCLASFLFVIFIRFNRQLQNHSKGVGDLYSILFAVHLGMNLMAISSNLLMIYISLEMVSIGSYLMVGYISYDKKQTEAALKYALFGAVCSAVMLYGISLIYGFTGTLSLTAPEFISGLSHIPTISSGVILVMVLVGIGFKLSFAPLHFWSPDVYEGAPTPVTAFLSTGPKIAGFAILIKFLLAFQLNRNGQFEYSLFNFNAILSTVAIASMIIGNFGAIWQSNVKRMLAYSSIGHTGFLLMAVIAFTDSGFKALVFYLVIYTLMNMLAFMLVDQIEERTGAKRVEEYSGLGKLLPALFICFVIVLVSLTGLPPTGGFIGKFLVFSSIFELYHASKSIWILALLLTGALTTLVSLFYYFKIPLYAYLKKDSILPVSDISRYQNLYLGFSSFITLIILVFGIFPQLITNLLKFI